MPEDVHNQKSRFRPSGFDYFVLSGAMVNVLVIVYLVGYWLLAA